MVILYIAGSEAGAGKTSVATAIAEASGRAGKRVALVRLALAGSAEASRQGGDNAFFRRVVPNGHHVPQQPLLVGPDITISASAPPWRDLLSADVTILEGLDWRTSSDGLGRLSRRIVDELDARALLVVRYRQGFTGQEIAQAAAPLGDRLGGVLINKVPGVRAMHTARTLLPELASSGAKPVGAVPEDRRMAAPTLRHVAELLDGEFLSLEEKADELVEHIMIGGWFLDEGRYVFGQRGRKAVLVRGDRPDLQMAALETDTVGLVLTGGKEPVQYTTYHAETQEVPIVATRLGTVDAMERIHGIHHKATVHHPQKVSRFLELLTASGALAGVFALAGLPAPQPSNGAAQVV